MAQITWVTKLIGGTPDDAAKRLEFHLEIVKRLCEPDSIEVLPTDERGWTVIRGQRRKDKPKER